MSGFFGSPLISHAKSKHKERIRRKGKRRVLQLEPLETRSLLATIVVNSPLDNFETDGLVTLREAIQAANTNSAFGDAIAGSDGMDVIDFDPSLNGETITLDGHELRITESLTIGSASSPLVTIDANQESRVINFIGSNHGDLTLHNLELVNGKTTEDNVTSFDVHSGGGIRFRSKGTLSLTNSSVSASSTAGMDAHGGGIFALEGDVILTNSTLSQNSTTGEGGEGGGMYTDESSVTLSGSTFSENSTQGSNAPGGGISTFSGSVLLEDSHIVGNSTGGDTSPGGGIYTEWRDSRVVLNNSTLSQNSTTGEDSGGGGIYTVASEVKLTNANVYENATTGNGSEGGGIRAGRPVTLNTSSLSGNSTTGWSARGGGIFTDDAKVSVFDSTVSANGTTGADSSGGGIAAGGVVLENSTISGNHVRGFSSIGGGVFSEYGSLTVNHSTVSDNKAEGNVNGGGGIWMEGLIPANAPVNISNSIVAGNSSVGTFGQDLTAHWQSEWTIRHSLIGISFGSSAELIQSAEEDGNQFNILDAKLGPLADNGGPTHTHALLTDSPAIDGGDPTLDATADWFDQRGATYARVLAGSAEAMPRIDIGAFEFQPPDPPVNNWLNLPVREDVNADGQITPLDALLVINELNDSVFTDPISGQLPVLRTPGAFFIDPTGDGKVTPLDAIRVINRLNSPISDLPALPAFEGSDLYSDDDDDMK